MCIFFISESAKNVRIHWDLRFDYNKYIINFPLELILLCIIINSLNKIYLEFINFQIKYLLYDKEKILSINYWKIYY